MNDGIVRVIGIDPGSNTGVAIYTLNAETFKIISIVTHTITLECHIDTEAGSKQIRKVMYLSSRIKLLIEQYNPIAIFSEDVFVNSRFPLAAIYLTQYLTAIEMAIKQYSGIKFFKIAPKLIKKMYSGGGSSDKDDMLTATINHPELKNYLIRSDLRSEYYTEHEVDAVAIGYIGLSYIRENVFVLVSF